MSRYDSVKVGRNFSGKKVYTSTNFPYIPPQEDDIYIITTVGDRLDTLAHRYYGNARHWWVIAMVNNLNQGKLTIEPGTQLRIPSEISSILNSFEKANS